MEYCDLFEHIYKDSEGSYERIARLDPVTRLAWNIVKDLMERRGYRQVWEETDDDVKNDIFSSIKVMIEVEFDEVLR